MSDLDAIKARVESASPGPWEVYDPNEGSGHGPLWSVANHAYHNPLDDEGDGGFNAYVECGVGGDAEFIAHARTDIPALLDLLAEREWWIGELRGLLAAAGRTQAALEAERDAARAELDKAWADRDEAVAVIVLAMHACNVDSPLWPILDDYDGSGDSIREVEAKCASGELPFRNSSLIFRSKRVAPTDPASGLEAAADAPSGVGTEPQLCTDKNGHHDPHDWRADPCDDLVWCPGYPVPKRAAPAAGQHAGQAGQGGDRG